MVKKIPEDLTVRVSTNAKKKTTTIVAYRKGGFKRAYKAIIPMCTDAACRLKQPHVKITKIDRYREYASWSNYHPRDVDTLVKRLINSYS